MRIYKLYRKSTATKDINGTDNYQKNPPPEVFPGAELLLSGGGSLFAVEPGSPLFLFPNDENGSGDEDG